MKNDISDNHTKNQTKINFSIEKFNINKKFQLHYQYKLTNNISATPVSGF